MSVKRFLDTNVLVYAYDTHEPRRQEVAQSLLKEGIAGENACLSAQVLGEFFNVVTRRIKKPLSAGEALEVMNHLSQLPVEEIDLALVKQAIENHKNFKISYWNGLVLAAAERAGCAEVHSEDLNEGQDYNGVRVVNPFKD